MKVAIYSFFEFERPFLEAANAGRHELRYINTRLSDHAVPMAEECDAVSLFINDDASAPILERLHRRGTKYITLRSAGYNHVDLEKAKELEMRVARVPAYSPYAIAEHAVALMLALNRKLIPASRRVQDLNFSLNGLVGFDMNGKTVGIVGTGKIGQILAKILHGFGCHILANDPSPNTDIQNKYDVRYVELDELCAQSDIITLQVPLNEQTHYLINADRIQKMKKGVMLINTSRGGLVDTKAVIHGLKSQQIGAYGADVYEEEEDLFFEDHSTEVLQDDVIARLLTFRNVLITSHQAFLTDTALRNIAETTIANLNAFEDDVALDNEL
ncbi:MAG: 2-hydroxyacid dehydrogenase [Bacteroidota bacterium]